MSTDQVMVQTAAGKQPLAEGIIYTHEHLWIDLTTGKDPQGKLDQLDAIIEEIAELKALGVSAIMELTCLGMGRDVQQLRRIQLETGVQIIPATGYYHHGFHPPTLANYSIDQIAETLAHELAGNLDGTNVTPMILGEIGGSGPPLQQDEVKVFQAVARLAQRFPVVVTTHAHLGQGGRDELQLLLQFQYPQADREKIHFLPLLEGKYAASNPIRSSGNVQGGLVPERILIGHLDLCPSLEEVLFIARQGAYVGIDTVGKTHYASEERRVAYVSALVNAGLVDRILLSCDISRNAYLRRQGGHGYAYLVRTFLPMLAAAGLSPAIIRQMTEQNPRRFLAGAHVTPLQARGTL